MRNQHTRLWNTLAAVTVVGALLSLTNTASLSLGIPSPTCFNNTDCGCTASNCSAPGQGGFCGNGTCACNPGYGGPNCSPLGACCGISICAAGPGQAADCAATACTDLTAAECQNNNGTSYAGDGTTCASGICDATPTATSTATATATATATNTPTRVPQGGSCTDVSECAPGLFCSDATCCDSACNGPQQACNLPGQQGICASTAAPAPAASSGGMVLMVGALIAVGLAALALRGRRA